MDFIRKLAARNASPAEHAPLLMAFLGDSVTQGCFEIAFTEQGEVDTRYDPEASYVALVRKYLRYLYPKAAVNTLNAGISGQRAKDGLKRLKRDVLDRKPDLLAVCFGLNDCMDGIGSLDEYANSLDEIFKQSLEQGVECMLITPNSMCRRVSANLKDERLIQIARDAAEKQNSGTLDLFVQAARDVARVKSLRPHGHRPLQGRQGVAVADVYEKWSILERMGVDTTAMLCNDINHPSPEALQIHAQTVLQTLFS